MDDADSSSHKKKKEDLTQAKHLIPELKHYIKRVNIQLFLIIFTEQLH